METLQDLFREKVKPNNYFGSRNDKIKRYSLISNSTLKLLHELKRRKNICNSNILIIFVKCLEEANESMKPNFQPVIDSLDKIYSDYKFPYCLNSYNQNRTDDVINCLRENYQLIINVCSDRLNLFSKPYIPENVSIDVSIDSKTKKILISNYDFQNIEYNKILLEEIIKVYKCDSILNDIFVDSKECYSDCLCKARDRINISQGPYSPYFGKLVNIQNTSFDIFESLCTKLDKYYDTFESQCPNTYRPKNDNGRNIKDNWLRIKAKWTDIMAINFSELAKLYYVLQETISDVLKYFDYLNYRVNLNSNKYRPNVSLSPYFDHALDKIFDRLSTIFNGNETMIIMYFYFFDKEIGKEIFSYEMEDEDFYLRFYPDYKPTPTLTVNDWKVLFP